MNEIILFAHPTFGVLGILGAVWIFVETLNASDANASRIRTAAWAVATFMVLPWVLGGYWYVHFYAPSAAVTVVFSTILTWAKETYAPLHDFMASLTGHHWTTHGLAAVAVFLVLGLVFLSWRVAERISPQRLIVALIGAIMAAGVG